MKYKKTEKKNLAFWNKVGRGLKTGGKIAMAVAPIAVTIISAGKIKMK
ncbi:hypothetical protein SAMN04488034_10913 [Salinimicrobium catena]|jgi:hypothetical protein|uniref:Uncharacterized protein n=1 Tax=Salinimicrobium catena TaxID=390640 RepID=A0A1H5P4T2_9FLAO|nr:hypothetical protein SAMN04488140_10969 [Salinimicrobium catena]SEF08943.1 hypothetical protein SAMN04488034_10913 [Salinimicrobium catena]